MWWVPTNANVEISRTRARSKHAENISKTRTEGEPEDGTLTIEQNVAGSDKCERRNIANTRLDKTLRTFCEDEDGRRTRNAYSENITERSRDGSMEGVAFD